MAKEPQLKASVVNPGMSFISTNLGEAAFKSILAAFDSKEISGKRLLPSAWVSEKTYHDLLVANSSSKWGDSQAPRGSTSTTNR